MGKRGIDQRDAGVVRGALKAALASLRGARSPRVTGLHVEVRAATRLTEAALREQFAALTRGTPFEGASLRIVWRPVPYRCASCLHHFRSGEAAGDTRCPRCGGDALAERPDTVRVRSIRLGRSRSPRGGGRPSPA